MTLDAVAAEYAKEKQQELSAAHNEYNAKINTALEGYKKAKDEYIKNVQTSTQSYLAQMGSLFDGFTVNANTSKADLLNNLQEQVGGFQAWSDEINRLSKRGVDDGLINELKQMGPKALPQIQALNQMTGQELESYVKLWGEKNKLAREAAEEEMKPLKDNVVAKLGEVETAMENQQSAMETAGGGLGKAIGLGIREKNNSLNSVNRKFRTKSST